MAKQEYRLQLILEQREEKKDECQKALNEAEKALKAEQKKLEQKFEERRQIDVRKAQATEDFQNRLMKPGCNISEEADRHDWYQKALDQEALRKDEEIAQQKAAVRRAEQAVEDAKAELEKARIELEALVKHKEKWAKEIKREEMEKEENALGELGEAMWLKQQREEAQRNAASRGGDGGGA
jgi:flagellar biosynthesis chaperone FliJ